MVIGIHGFTHACRRKEGKDRLPPRVAVEFYDYMTMMTYSLIFSIVEMI
jgi:hypothetical protein